MLVFSIDPGTGKSSPTAVTFFDPLSKKIAFTRIITSEMELQHHRLFELKELYEKWLQYAVKMRPREQFLVASETFVMRGKGGETLQRLIGVYEAATPTSMYWRTVYNTTVKRLVGGRGDSDKLDVALGVRYFFQELESSRKYVDDLIADKEWDRTDALAIGISAWIQEQYLSEKPDKQHLAAAKVFENADKQGYVAALRNRYNGNKAPRSKPRERKR